MARDSNQSGLMLTLNAFAQKYLSGQASCILLSENICNELSSLATASCITMSFAASGVATTGRHASWVTGVDGCSLQLSELDQQRIISDRCSQIINPMEHLKI